jgi:tetratricopeptide (TPR) repeat protein
MQGVLAGPGTVLAGRYTIERELGRGGMATVYLAHDLRHDRAVAVKVLRPEVAASLGPQRFLREIQIAAHLTHPHILPLHDSGQAGELLYYVMPFIDGESLQDRIRRDGPLPVQAAVRIASDVADALSYAHAQSIVHRDIKPGNILLEAGHAVVSDFGIARALSEAAGEEITTSGLAIGTPMYMSPEQVAGNRVDGRSDVYSLGCVLYEMLTGGPPFGGPNAQAVAARHLNEPPPTLSSVRPEVPPGLSAAVETALAKRPDDRFPTAARFAEALETSRWSKAPSRLVGWVWRAAGLAALLGGLLFAGRRIIEEPKPVMREPAWILVADFEGSPKDRSLTDAVRELVTAELDQSPVIAPMPRQQLMEVLHDAGLADTARLTIDRARELALRSSVRAILTGGVQRIAPDRYAMVLKVSDADSGRVILSVAGAATGEDLVPQIQKLARRVREGLGERRGTIEANKPLIQVATPSFQAYRKFAQGVGLSEKGDLAASNNMMREALELDTGFAAAWAAIGVNQLTARNLDSARIAFGQALRRPERLSDAERYRLEAEAAYTFRYDMQAALQWYDRLLQEVPRSTVGHNNRGMYLSSLGRYQEALDEFRQAAALDPFAPAKAQIQIFNETVTLLALGQVQAAADVARKLTGSYGAYAAMLLAVAKSNWSEAESLTRAAAGRTETPGWLRRHVVTIWAGSLAARGAIRAADELLRSEAAAVTEKARAHWFDQARLLLAAATGRRPGRVPDRLAEDSTAGGVLTRGLWRAMAGDTLGARRELAALQGRPAVELLRLSLGPSLLQGWLAARSGNWSEVTRVLGPAALDGEHDAADMDQVSSLAVRWLMADAYEHLGKLDSAAAYFELAITPMRVPFSHLGLRGLAYSFAQRRLALLYDRMRRPQVAGQHWNAFLHAFVRPDPEVAPLRFGARDRARVQ